MSIAGHLDNYGRIYYGEKNFAEAFNSFNTILDAKKELDAAGEKIILKGPYYTSFAFRVVIQPPEAPAPVTVYALHPHPPTGPVAKAQREYELQFVAERITEDSSKNIVMMGDWNITPFSPYFKDVLNISGLNYQAYGFMQNPTWLSINGFKFLKIPIDHMLFSDGLSQMNKYAGPAFMSDHHMLIGEYAVKD